jgi:hypothetical protein
MSATRVRPWLRKHTLHFEGVREVSTVASSEGKLLWPAALAPLLHGLDDCTRRGSETPPEDCRLCRNFVNARPDHATGLITVRCLWTDEDPIALHAQAVPAWRVVAPDTPVETARQLTTQHAAPFLLVADGELFVGIVERAALEGADGTVEPRADREPWVLPLDATLGDAAEALAVLGVAGLPVVDAGGRLAGIVSASDLSRIGVPIQSS